MNTTGATLSSETNGDVLSLNLDFSYSIHISVIFRNPLSTVGCLRSEIYCLTNGNSELSNTHTRRQVNVTFDPLFVRVYVSSGAVYYAPAPIYLVESHHQLLWSSPDVCLVSIR